MKARRSIPALGAFFVLIALVVAGCGSSGSSIPSGAAANVAGNPIPLRAVNHWLYLYVKGQSAEQGQTSAPVIVPNDPPQFTSCIAQAKAADPQLKEDSDAQVRSECKAEFTQLTGEIMPSLIESYWYQGLGHKEGINVTSAQVSKTIAKEMKAQGIKTNAQLSQTLSQYGETIADLNWRTRVQLVQQKLAAKYSTKVTSADIAAYYKKNSSKFGTPETRNIRIVLAKTSATAKTALAALKRGESWNTVAKKYSIDPTTKDKGGLQTDVSKGQEEAALSNAAFAASKNKLQGPIKGEFGYYDFEVIAINPATHESLAKATPEIKQELTSTKQSAASKAILAKAKKAYMSRTFCAKDYSVSVCHGYVKPKATATTPATGATGAAGSTGASGSTATSSSTGSATTTTSTTASKKKK